MQARALLELTRGRYLPTPKEATQVMHRNGRQTMAAEHPATFDEFPPSQAPGFNPDTCSRRCQGRQRNQGNQSTGMKTTTSAAAAVATLK